MEIKFTGKRALVTGAAQGIGLDIVKKLVACGAEVVALDVQEDKLRKAVKEIPGVEPVVCDLSDWESTRETMRSIGQVQLVVNNAGVICNTTAQYMQEDSVDRVLNVNLKAVMNICKHVVSVWSAEGIQGAIVNISSALVIRPYALLTAYSASKAAVLQYTRCLALDCAPKGIRVNAVSPGPVDTEALRSTYENPDHVEFLNRTVPMPDKLLDPEDVANAVVFLLCNKMARRITGVNLVVDAGFVLT